MGRKKWTESEEQILRDHYADMDKDELMSLLPGRKWASVNKKARRLGIARTAHLLPFGHCCDEVDAMGLVTCIGEEPENFRARYDKISFICNECGGRHSAKYDNLLRGKRGCCSAIRNGETQALPFEQCCDEIDALGSVTCIREEPENFRSSKDKMLFICNECGGRHSATYSSLRGGHRGCCGSARNGETRALPFEHCCGEIDAQGLVVCIREEPENFRSSKDKIPFICNECGGRHSAKYDNLLRGKRGCCGSARNGETRALPFEQCCDEIDALGLVTCIREEPENFRSSKDKMLFICNECGGSHSALYGRLLEGRLGCCGQNGKFKKYLITFSERQSIEGYVEERFPDCICRRPLPFDGYIPSANLLIEGQGMQHLREDHYQNRRGGRDPVESYADLHFRDQIKREWAAENGYRLLYIPVEMYDDTDRMDRCILDAMASTDMFIDHCSHLDQEFPSKWLQLFSSPCSAAADTTNL